jgi:hypothetical protein
MEYITKELDLLDIQFNPNIHYFTDRIDEEYSNTVMHSIRVPYEGGNYYECDTITDAYRLCFDIVD